MSKDTILERVTHQYSQEPDCCSQLACHSLVIDTQDGGGGPYLIIETERWALDREGIADLSKLLTEALDRIEI